MEATNGGQLAMGSLTLNNVGGTITASGKRLLCRLSNEGQGGETITGGTFTTSNGGVIQVVEAPPRSTAPMATPSPTQGP